jgi:hypothetical protein
MKTLAKLLKKEIEKMKKKNSINLKNKLKEKVKS